MGIGYHHSPSPHHNHKLSILELRRLWFVIVVEMGSGCCAQLSPQLRWELRAMEETLKECGFWMGFGNFNFKQISWGMVEEWKFKYMIVTCELWQFVAAAILLRFQKLFGREKSRFAVECFLCISIRYKDTCMVVLSRSTNWHIASSPISSCFRTRISLENLYGVPNHSQSLNFWSWTLQSIPLLRILGVGIAAEIATHITFFMYTAPRIRTTARWRRSKGKSSYCRILQRAKIREGAEEMQHVSFNPRRHITVVIIHDSRGSTTD